MRTLLGICVPFLCFNIGIFGMKTLAMLLLVLFAANGLGAEVIPLKTLRGNNLNAAREARDQADRMREDFERRLSGPPSARPQISQEEIDAKSLEIIRAYLDVIVQYPHTEIAAHCTLMLSGFLGTVGARRSSQTDDQCREAICRHRK